MFCNMIKVASVSVHHINMHTLERGWTVRLILDFVCQVGGSTEL